MGTVKVTQVGICSASEPDIICLERVTNDIKTGQGWENLLSQLRKDTETACLTSLICILFESKSINLNILCFVHGSKQHSPFSMDKK